MNENQCVTVLAYVIRVDDMSLRVIKEVIKWLMVNKGERCWVAVMRRKTLLNKWSFNCSCKSSLKYSYIWYLNVISLTILSWLIISVTHFKQQCIWKCSCPKWVLDYCQVSLPTVCIRGFSHRQSVLHALYLA